MKTLEAVVADLLRNRGTFLRYATIVDDSTIRLAGSNITSFIKIGTFTAAGTRIAVLVDGLNVIAFGESDLSPASTTAPDPSTATPGTSATGLPQWETERRAVTASIGSWALLHVPLPRSIVLSLNGLVLQDGEDYEVADNTVTFIDASDLWLGITGTWHLHATYPYLVDATTPTDPPPTEVPEPEPPGFSGTVLSMEPWGYWHLDEPSTLLPTEDVVDYSGNGRHGYYGVTTPAGLDQDPLEVGLSRSTSYDGGQDAVQIDHVQEDFDAGFTVTAWAMPSDITGNQAVVGSTYEGSITLFKLCCHDGVWRCESYWDGNFQQPEGGLAVVDTLQWVVARYDGNVTIELFIDNVLIDTVTCTAPLPSGLSQDYLRIATRGDNTPVEQYVGTISDVAIWDRALSDFELDVLWDARLGTGAAPPTPGTPPQPGGGTPPPIIPPPPVPITSLLTWAPPDTAGAADFEVPAAGGKFTLDNSKDWVIDCPVAVTGPLAFKGGRDITIIGLVRDQPTTPPPLSSKYDGTHYGLRFYDGPDANLERTIFVEGYLLREGYFSDGLQTQLRTENFVTLVLQNMLVADDAFIYGRESGVHADLIQFYGGPRVFLSDSVTARNLTYQGAYLDVGDKRGLPASGGPKWRVRRWNLEGSNLTDGARYLLADRQPAFSRLECEDVYTLDEGYDATGWGKWPSAGLTQSATPPGGDFVLPSLWTGTTYTSPGYEV